MRMAAQAYYSAEMVRALPDDGRRYETVHGELLVTPAPRAWHQEIAARLLLQLRYYLDEQQVGHVFASPADLSWGPDILVQPDLFVVTLDEARTLDWSRMRSLLLTIEVLSPTTVRYDRFTKRRLYQEVGVPLYWMVDPDDSSVEVWTPEAVFPTTQRERLVWQPAGAGKPLVIELGELFERSREARRRALPFQGHGHSCCVRDTSGKRPSHSRDSCQDAAAGAFSYSLTTPRH